MSSNSSQSDDSETFSDFSLTQSDPDTDSSTTSTSWDDNEVVLNPEEKTILKNQLKEQLIQPIMPKPFNKLFSNEVIDDSFELSLLRFIHLVFSSDSKINFDNLIKYMNMEKNSCIELLEYFENNPGVMNDYQFYYSNTGIDIRTKWFEILKGQKFFTYKGDEQQIEPTTDNLFEFFEQYFPNLDLSGNTNQEKLSNIYSQLNFNFDNFEVIYSTFQKITGDTVQNSSIQNIQINGVDIYVWEMTKIKDTSNIQPVELYSESEFKYE